MAHIPIHSEGGRRPVFGKETLMPVGFVLVVGATVLGFQNWLYDRLGSIDRRIGNIETMMVDRWTGTQQMLWVEKLGRELERKHPDINVPSVEEILRASGGR